MKQVKQAKKEEMAQPANATAPKVANPIIQVKPGQKYRGARQAWYERLLKFDGKPLAALITDVTANSPSLPAKGAKAGTPEPVRGWVRFFERTGVLNYK